MNLERDCQLFLSSLNVDLTIGKNHLIDDVPFKFTAPDFLYFFSLKDKFWTSASEQDKLTISLAMTELYVSVLLHIYSSDYRFNEEVHHLENTILYGDLLSGAFAEKLVAINEAVLLKEWLEVLQAIHKDLIALSLEHQDIKAKKEVLLNHLLDYLIPQAEKEKFATQTKALLLDHSASFYESEIAAELPEYIKEAMKKPILSSGDFLAFIGE